MKELETTPWYICNEEDTNYCAYMDTDSVYIHAEPILRYLYPDFDTMSDEQKDEALIFFHHSYPVRILIVPDCVRSFAQFF